MEISTETREFVRQIDDFSRHKLKNLETVALLIELARAKGQEEKIEEIAFFSKFLTNTFGILNRSSSDLEGYEKLTKEFRENLETVIEAIRELIDSAKDETKENFTKKFLGMTSENFENLLTLLYDLSWLKNWYIDQKSLTGGEKNSLD